MSGGIEGAEITNLDQSSIIKFFAHSDLRKLQRDYPEVDSQRPIDRCTDLGVWCNEVCNTGGRWSMERLVMYLVSS